MSNNTFDHQRDGQSTSINNAWRRVWRALMPLLTGANLERSDGLHWLEANVAPVSMPDNVMRTFVKLHITWIKKWKQRAVWFCHCFSSAAAERCPYPESEVEQEKQVESEINLQRCVREKVLTRLDGTEKQRRNWLSAGVKATYAAKCCIACGWRQGTLARRRSNQMVGKCENTNSS